MVNGCLRTRPWFQNMPYYSEEIDQLPALPVLGILHFCFHPGVDILEQSQPASLLWCKSLEFVSTIPGSQGLSWATINKAPTHQQVIVLIQWKSQQSWKLFQSSLGFSMMLGYILKISNRCVQLVLPIDIFEFDCHLELVSFGFSTMLSTTQLQRKAEFKAQWATAFSHLNHPASETELISVCGEWLEKDNDISEDQFFVGLLFWASSTQADFPQVLQVLKAHKVETLLESLVRDATEVITAYTNQLNHVSFGLSGLRPYDPTPIFVQSETNHDIFKTPVKPKYNASESANQSGSDKFHLESMRQARRTPPERIGLAPAGVWYPMGFLSQHYLPPGQKINLPADSPSNMAMISFFAQTGNKQVATSFAVLRKKLWRLGYCPQLVWGKDQRKKDGQDTFLLFIGRFAFFP